MITHDQMAEWRRALQARGAGAPALALHVAPLVMDELERTRELMAQAERELAAREAAALEKRLADVVAFGGECQTCHNAEARAVVARLRKIARE